MALTLTFLPEPVSAVEAEQFPLRTFKNFQRALEVPDQENNIIIDAAVPGLSVVVRNSGEVRNIPEDKWHFMEAFAKSVVRDKSWIRRYRQEVRVIEQNRSYWLPVQKAVLPRLLKRVPIDKEFTIYTRYFGTFGTAGRVFVTIDFDAEVLSWLPRMSCFSRELVGVQLGTPLRDVKKQLTLLYGRPLHEGIHEQRLYYAFDLDPKYHTQLIVTDAGSGYRQNVFAIQVTGPLNPDLLLHKNLRLGSSPAEVERVLGKPVSRRDTGKGYTLLSYENSRCSVELKNGVLASILIMDDPNYFSE